MTLRGIVLRLAGFLVRRAVRLLPESARSERRREWTAELPAILDDSDGGSGRRAARVLRFAAGQRRAARRLARASGTRTRSAAIKRVALLGAAAGVAAIVAGNVAASSDIPTDGSRYVSGVLAVFAGAVVLAACLSLIIGMAAANSTRLLAGACAGVLAGLVCLFGAPHIPGGSAGSWISSAGLIITTACVMALAGVAVAKGAARLRRPPGPSAHASAGSHH